MLAGLEDGQLRERATLILHVLMKLWCLSNDLMYVKKGTVPGLGEWAPLKLYVFTR